MFKYVVTVAFISVKRKCVVNLFTNLYCVHNGRGPANCFKILNKTAIDTELSG